MRKSPRKSSAKSLPIEFESSDEEAPKDDVHTLAAGLPIGRCQGCKSAAPDSSAACDVCVSVKMACMPAAGSLLLAALLSDWCMGCR